MFTFLLLVIILIFILFLALLPLTLLLPFLFGPPYLPTPKNVIDEMLNLADVNESDVVADLGSGDGAVLIKASMRGAQSRGWEINPFLVTLTRIRARIKGLNNKIIVHAKPYQKANLKDVTVVFLYSMPKFMPAIENKLREQAPKSIKIISYKFPLPNFKLVIKTQSGIFMYKL